MYKPGQCRNLSFSLTRPAEMLNLGHWPGLNVSSPGGRHRWGKEEGQREVDGLSSNPLGSASVILPRQLRIYHHTRCCSTALPLLSPPLYFLPFSADLITDMSSFGLHPPFHPPTRFHLSPVLQLSKTSLFSSQHGAAFLCLCTNGPFFL